MSTNNVKSVLLIAMLSIASAVMAQSNTLTDSQGRVISSVNPDGSTTTYVYGPQGTKGRTVDVNGKVTEFDVPNTGNQASPTK